MTIPTPPSSLDDSCSVIHGNTLYSYTAEAFLSLDLTEGAEWKELAMGEKVTGGVCVGTTPGDDSRAALFIVGGTGGTGDYTGLQKFTYATGEWTTITPSVQVTKDRRWHGSTYLKANDAIVVYAGTSNGVEGPGSETFTIQASEPYEANAYGASSHSATDPILLNWSDADVVLLGGDSSNTGVSLFNPAAGWRDSGATLANPLPKDTESIQAIMMNGNDGSKSLYTFDLTQSPNVVSRYILQDASGAPVHNSAPVSNAKRDLTLSDWPEYNSTLAPTATRTNYAIAQGADGMVVFSGGNAEEPLAIFNAAENSWVDSGAMFSDDEQKVLSESTTTSAEESSSTEASSTSSSSEKSRTSKTATSDASSTEASSATSFTSIASATATATSDATASATSTGEAVIGAGEKSSDGGSSGPSANVILGITLGSIIAFLGLLAVLLFLIRRRRAQQSHAEIGHARRASGPALAEKDPSAFANNTLPPPSPGHYRGHHPRGSQESYSSMAILMGRIGQNQPSSASARKPSKDTNRSSMDSLHKEFKATISKPIPQVADHPALQGRDERGVAFDPTVAEPRSRNGPLKGEDGTRRSSGWNRYWSGGSALQILGFGAPKRATMLSEQSSRYSEATQRPNPRATQDSATVPPLNFEGRPEFNRVNSGSPVVAQNDSRIPFQDGMAGKIERPNSRDSSGYSSGIPESVNDAWDPNDLNQPWGANRAPSSTYTPSFYYGAPNTANAAGARQPPSGVSTQPQLAMASTSSDMSWLNLGDRNQV